LEMAYTALYSISDLQDMIVDLLGALFAVLVTFAPILVIVAIAGALLAIVGGFIAMTWLHRK